MNEKCGNCGSPNLKTIPDGISKKTGKPYKAFSVCSDCKAPQNPPRGSNMPPAQINTVPPPPSKVEGLLEDIRDILTEIRDRKGEIPF